MKQVKNRRTGDIGELDFDSKEGVFIVVRYDLNTKEMIKSYYKSLEDLCEEWEDVPEEPKEYWAIDQFGEPINVSGLSRLQLEKLHRIGNDFPSENATMKAVEKLKAWKRLKDKGFRFNGCIREHKKGSADITIESHIDDDCGTTEDLYLLFGGKE